MNRALMAFLILAALFSAGCVPLDSSSRVWKTLRLDDGLEMAFILPAGEMQFTRTAPDGLVRQMLEHLEKEAADSGIKLNTAQLQQVARKRLAVNEAFVYNPSSGANLMIDFRRLRLEEKPVGKNDLIGSAYGAELALRNQSGVTEVSSKTRRMRIPGSGLAYRTDISYRQDNALRRFVGIIGCTESHRYYLYFNDLLRDPRDAGQMKRLFRSLTIHEPPESS